MVSTICRRPPPALAIFSRGRNWLRRCCVVALTALGWLALGLMTARNGDICSALCRLPALFRPPLNAGDTALVASMWAAMVLAMMLPSAAPMILTYAEIADTAARKNEQVVSPLMLAAGYTRCGSALPRRRRWRNSR